MYKNETNLYNVVWTSVCFEIIVLVIFTLNCSRLSYLALNISSVTFFSSNMNPARISANEDKSARVIVGLFFVQSSRCLQGE